MSLDRRLQWVERSWFLYQNSLTVTFQTVYVETSMDNSLGQGLSLRNCPNIYVVFYR